VKTRHFVHLLLGCWLLSVSASAQKTSAPQTRTPVATVSGETIYDDQLAASVQSQILPLRKQEFDIKKRALDGLIDQKLVEADARKKGLTIEKLLETEVDSKVPEPNDAELQGYYLAQRERFNRPLNDIKDQLRQVLKQAKIQQARQDYVSALRTNAQVAILISAPRVEVAHDPARVKGNPNAPITIVEFSDYECPYCRQVEPTLKGLMTKYKDKIKIAYRDFPLTNHPHAKLAAEASRCAGEQGKFWEYHDQLMSSSDLQKPALIGFARGLHLDAQKFASCLDEGKYKADVERDQIEGMQAGISGTPGFFVNGVPLVGAQSPDAFIRLIESELDSLRQAKK